MLSKRRLIIGAVVYYAISLVHVCHGWSSAADTMMIVGATLLALGICVEDKK
jgi:hypothetical protein